MIPFIGQSGKDKLQGQKAEQWLLGTGGREGND